MNVLIVDDDRYVVASLLNGLNWPSLGFDQVYKDYSMIDAKKIIEEKTVDLLISDIDMPHGSGLDLLSWIRECHNQMPVIFLTNYADFNYAKKAMDLKSFHYFLKPIEFDKLSAIIQEATQELGEKQTQTSKNCENFWHSFHQSAFSGSEEELRQFFARFHVPYHVEDLFVPILFDVCPYYLTATNTLKNHFANGEAQFLYLKNTFDAVFSDLITTSDVFLEYNAAVSRYLAVIHLDSRTISPLLLMACENLIQLISTQMHCTVNCFVGKPSSFSDFHKHFSALTSMVNNKLDCRQWMMLLSEYLPAKESFPPFDSTLPELYLENKQYSAFLDYCRQYLKKLSIGGYLHSLSMTSFQVDVVQVLYTFLKSKGILANKLFHNDSYHILSNIARKSVLEMNLYLQYMIKTIEIYLESSLSEKSLARSMKEYVDQHYTEDLNRSVLTDIFFMDSDYASKLFKKEFGISFKNYIINKRIDAAKDLLSSTNLPINLVAANVGYENYSYFTRLF